MSVHRLWVLSCAGLVCLSGCQPTNSYVSPPPPTVTVANPIVDNVTIYLEENGETEAVQRAVVSARVQGVIERIEFQEGQQVEGPSEDGAPGTLLYVIEQQQYAAKVESAKANVAAAIAKLESANAAVEVSKAAIGIADAELTVARTEFERLDGLLRDNAVAQRDVDNAKANYDTATAARAGAGAQLTSVEADVEEAKAQEQQARADFRQAEIDLEYTSVHAPISGRVSSTDVKLGNLVENGTSLVTIVQQKPIWAKFNINERLLLELEGQANRTPDDRLDLTHIPAFLQRTGDIGFPFEGHLDYGDIELDQGTGTLSIRAVFPNDLQQRILPGMFVRVRVPIGVLENALLIPERAIGRDQAGSYVIVIGSDNVAARRNVVIRSKQNDMVVIKEGLDANDAIVTEGLQRARPGAEVKPSRVVLPSATEQSQPSDN